DLATLSRLPAEVHLVGSHGSEFDIGFVHALEPEATELQHKLERELNNLTTGLDGVSLEVKPASVAVHVRRAAPEIATQALEAVRQGPCRWPGVTVTEGKEVIELSVVATDKGNALDTLRHQVGATAAVFVGDDVTDEKVFGRLTGPDVGIKVGQTDSLAMHAVSGTEDVATVLAFLLEERRHWLYGEQAPPLERLTMLANERSVALLTPDAELTWLCHPGPDAPAIFASL